MQYIYTCIKFSNIIETIYDAKKNIQSKKFSLRIIKKSSNIQKVCMLLNDIIAIKSLHSVTFIEANKKFKPKGNHFNYE